MQVGGGWGMCYAYTWSLLVKKGLEARRHFSRSRTPGSQSKDKHT